MPSLESLIDGTYKDPSATVRFNGNRTKDVLSIAVTDALEGSIGTANIRLLGNPNVSPDDRVFISQGYEGQERATFTGYVDTVEYNTDGTFSVTCRDVLKKALDTFLVQEVKFGLELTTGTYYYSTYTSSNGGTFTVHTYASLSALNAAHPETTGNYSGEGVKAHAVVQWLIHMSGLSEGSEIQVDDSNFWIGDINPAKFHLTSVYDAAVQIANLIGWRIFADKTGVVRFKRKPRAPGGYTFWTYSDVRSPYNLYRASRPVSSLDLRTYVEVRGASGIRSIARGTSPYLGNTPYRGVLISEELIDTQDMADFFANRVLKDLNRLKVTIALEVDGNPYLVTGSTITLNSRVGSGKYLVEGIQANMATEGYRMSITGAQYLGDTDLEEDPTANIYAVFIPISMSVIGDPKYVVTFDGSSSASDRGIIANYYWAWPDGSNTSSANSTAVYVFDETEITGGNSATVSLTVTDSLGNQATTSSGVTLEWLETFVNAKYRALYGAMNDHAVGSLDGGQTWARVNIPAISAAASNFATNGVYTPSGYALFGTSTGAIYKTIDGCTTATNVFTADGPVTDIVVPELDWSRAAAVTSAGSVYYSDTGGESWQRVGTLGISLRQIKMGFTDFDYLVAVGSGMNRLYETTNRGATWARITNTLDILWATDGAATNYYAHTAGVQGGSTALAFNGGGTYMVPAATVAVDNDAGVMIVDSAGQHWNYGAASGFVATQNSASNPTRHMIRDGELLGVVYYATASGVYKSLDGNVTIAELYTPATSPPTGMWGKKIAYGPMAEVLLPGALLYRGGMTISGIPSSTRWYSASSTLTSWIDLFSDPGGTAVANRGIIALDDDINLHKITVVASSGVASVVNVTKNENWYTFTSDPNYASSIAWNRRPDSRDTLVCIAVGGPDILNTSYYGVAFPNFDTSPSTGMVTEQLFGPSLIRGGGSQYVTSVLGELVYEFKTSLFAPSTMGSTTFVPVDGIPTISVTNLVGTTTPQFAPFQKSNSTFKGIIRDAGGALDMKLCAGYILDWFLEPLNIPDPLGYSSNPLDGFAPHVYSSIFDPGRIYYATYSGVYYADSYGQGQSIQLLTPSVYAAGESVLWMHAYPNKEGDADILTCVVGEQTAPSIVRCLFSVDSGTTWQRGPDVINPDSVGELYYLEARTT